MLAGWKFDLDKRVTFQFLLTFVWDSFGLTRLKRFWGVAKNVSPRKSLPNPSLLSFQLFCGDLLQRWPLRPWRRRSESTSSLWRIKLRTWPKKSSSSYITTMQKRRGMTFLSVFVRACLCVCVSAVLHVAVLNLGVIVPSGRAPLILILER